jgi:hypothetical protein
VFAGFLTKKGGIMVRKRETPAEVLAKKITQRLSKEGLLNPDRAARFSASLAAGKLRESDWRLEIESLFTAGKTQKKGK